MMKIIPMAAALGLTLALSIPAEAAGISISPLTKSLGWVIRFNSRSLRMIS